MQLTIHPLTEPLPELTGLPFDPEDEPFCEGEYAPIDTYTWDETGYTPEARAYVRWSAEGLHVLMCANEETIHAEEKTFNGAVCRDSCLEFFLMPFPDDGRYLNIEVNAIGTAHVGLGTGRHGRKLLSELPEAFELQASRHRGAWWAVRYIIPRSFIMDVFDRVPAVGDTMRGNFYTCDETIHPHFGAWSPVIHFCPDFHRPEYFSDLICVEA